MQAYSFLKMNKIMSVDQISDVVKWFQKLQKLNDILILSINFLQSLELFIAESKMLVNMT